MIRAAPFYQDIFERFSMFSMTINPLDMDRLIQHSFHFPRWADNGYFSWYGYRCYLGSLYQQQSVAPDPLKAASASRCNGNYLQSIALGEEPLRLFQVSFLSMLEVRRFLIWSFRSLTNLSDQEISMMVALFVRFAQ